MTTSAVDRRYVVDSEAELLRSSTCTVNVPGCRSMPRPRAGRTPITPARHRVRSRYRQIGATCTVSDGGVDEVHRRRADERGDNIDRVVMAPSACPTYCNTPSLSTATRSPIVIAST